MGNINQIATKYILSMDIDNLRKLHDKKYCNKLTDVTSKAIYQSKEGSKDERNEEIDEVIDKQDKCDKMAMFYIQIAHIYAVITLTLQPNICAKSKSKKNKFCTINQGHDQDIPELMHLYYDSDYNPKTGEFEGMTEKTRKIFEQNLKDFYIHFTGNLLMPENIKTFSDIKLHQYDALNDPSNKLEQEQAQEQAQPFITSLFKKYSEHLKNMTTHVAGKQTELINILNHIFIKDTNDITIINPKLNEDSVQSIMIETRNCIMELHLKYEDDYNESIKIYEAIVESILFLTLKNEIESLNNMLKYPTTKHSNKTR